VSHNTTNMYDIEPHIAEIYDNQENYTDDVELIRSLIGDRVPLNILESFCGTGRIIIPLALDGHNIIGLDQARGMLERARSKISKLPGEVQSRITLVEADVTSEDWPENFDLVILGGNCLYELATPEEQEKCIISAANSLKSGGYVYVDNDHMEGELDSSWQESGASKAFPTGKCSDGTDMESWWEATWWNVSNRLIRYRRTTKVAFPDGKIIQKEYVQQKHPVSASEVQTWLETNGFLIKQMYGDRAAGPYIETLERAIFWAVKE
jgi:SAM-dependent methyltransferase